jgi:hypothetical protein
MKRWLKTISLTLVATVLVLLVGITGLYVFSRTPAGSRFLLSQAKSYLATKKIEITYDRSEVDPFSHVRFENLKLIQHLEEGNRMEVGIGSLDIHYALSLFSRSVAVDNFKAKGVTVLVHERFKDVPVAAVEKNEEYESSSGNRFSLEGLKEKILYPPVKISLKECSLEDLVFDVAYHDPSTSVIADLGIKEIHFDLDFARTALSFGGGISLKPSNHASVSILRAGVRTNFEAAAKAVVSFSGALKYVDGEWLYDIKPISADLDLDKVAVRQEGKSTTTYKIAKISAHLTGEQVANDLRFNLIAGLTDMMSSEFSVLPSSFEIQSGAHLTRDFKRFKGTSFLTFEGKDLARLDFISFAGPALAVDGKLEFHPRADISKYLKAGAGLSKFGSVYGNLSIKSSAEEEIHSLLDMERFHEGDLHLELVQYDKQLAKTLFEPVQIHAHLVRNGKNTAFKIDLESARLESDSTIATNPKLSLDGDWGDELLAARLNVVLPGFQSPSLKKSLALGFSTKVGWEYPRGEPGRLETEGLLRLYDEDVMSFKGTSLIITGNRGAGSFKVDGSTAFTQLSKKYPCFFQSPLSISHKVDLNDQIFSAALEVDARSFEVDGVGEFLGTWIGAKVSSAPQSELHFSIDVRQQKVILDSGQPLSGLNLTANASYRAGERFVLENLNAEFNRSMVSLEGEATGTMRKSEFQTTGLLSVRVPPDFPPIMGQSVSGELKIPWKISFLGRKNVDEVNFEGVMEVKDLAWSKGPAMVSGVTGKVPVSERLEWEGKKIRFAKLIQQNPFERVDFDRLRPLIQGAGQVSIARIGYLEKRYGPLTGSFSLRQNLLIAHQFDVTLGASGVADGEMYLDIYPSNLQLGMLTRLTSVNLLEILPKKYLVKVPEGEKYISGRSGLVVNLNKGSVDGRVDITQIGGAQLLTLINALDPTYENDRMNRTRAALGLGQPTFVEMAFDQGYMDMGVQLAVLGVSQRFDVRGIPVSSFVASATEDFVKRTAEAPIE